MTEIATQGDNLPAQAYNPAQITADDVNLSRIKPGDPSNKRVKQQKLPLACIFAEESSDDPDPELLAKGIKGEVSEPIRFFVLDGPRASYSWKDDKDNFYVRPANHPDLIAQIEKYGDKGGDQKQPRKGFNYLVALPDGDVTLPYKLLLKGASSNSAKQLNRQLLKASVFGPPSEVLFEAKVRVTERGEYVYCVWEIKRTDVPDSELEGLIEKVKPLTGLAQSLGGTEKSLSEADVVSEVSDAPDLS